MENPNVHDFIEEFRLLLDRMIPDLENGHMTPHDANIEISCAAILYPASYLLPQIETQKGKTEELRVLDVRGRERIFKTDRNGWLLCDLSIPEYGRHDFEDDYMLHQFMCFHYPQLSNLPFIGFVDNVLKSNDDRLIFCWKDAPKYTFSASFSENAIMKFCANFPSIKDKSDMNYGGDLRENFDYMLRQKIGKGFLSRNQIDAYPFIIDVIDYFKNNLE